MNLGEQKAALKRYGFDDGDPLAVWLNAAKDEVVDMYSWPWLYEHVSVGIVAGDNVLVMPADFDKVVSLRVDTTDGPKLSPLEPNALDRDFPVYNIPGTPTVYVRYGDTILVYPTPDVNTLFKLTYTKTISDVTDDAQIYDVPLNLHYSIVRGAAYIALQAENEEDRATVAMSQFETDLARKWARSSTPNEDDPDQVVDVMGYTT